MLLPLVASKHSCTLGPFTPGVGMCDPSRKMATMNSTNSSFLRRSGVRKALANAPSTCSSFGCRSGRLEGDQIRGSLTGQDDRPQASVFLGAFRIILPCHGRYVRQISVAVPPAAAIFSLADPEKPCAVTWTATEMSP